MSFSRIKESGGREWNSRLVTNDFYAWNISSVGWSISENHALLHQRNKGYRSYVLIFSIIRKKFANNRFLLILGNLFNFFFFLLTWIGIVRRHTRNQWNFLRPITSESGGISIRTIDEGRHSPPRLLDKSVCQFGRWQAVTRSWRSSHAVTTHLVANANTKRIPWKSLQIEKELSVHTLDMRVRARPRSLPSSDIGEGSVGYVYRQGRQIRW